MTITCKGCGKSFSFDLDSTPYMRIDCFSEEIKEKRTYRPKCTYCQSQNTITVTVKEKR